ncbi:TetR family transcriptional regulator [Nocardia rhamnosiphila]
MLDATIGVVVDNDFDAMTMREVASRTDVPIGAVYDRFPSKVHLMIAALQAELLLFESEVRGALRAITDPAERLKYLVDRLTFGMQRSHQVTEAMTRACTVAWAMAIPEMDVIREQTTAMFVSAFAGTTGKPMSPGAAEVLAEIWLSEIVAVAQSRCSVTELRARLMLVIDLLDGTPGAAPA